MQDERSLVYHFRHGRRRNYHPSPLRRLHGENEHGHCSEFTRTGHLGCPKCYEAFREQLQPMLLQIHGRVQHAGRQPLSTAEEQRKRSATEQLQRQMEQAVALEDFETAAKLRDQIRALSVSGEEEA